MPFSTGRRGWQGCDGGCSGQGRGCPNDPRFKTCSTQGFRRFACMYRSWPWLRRSRCSSAHDGARAERLLLSAAGRRHRCPAGLLFTPTRLLRTARTPRVLRRACRGLCRPCRRFRPAGCCATFAAGRDPATPTPRQLRRIQILEWRMVRRRAMGPAIYRPPVVSWSFRDRSAPKVRSNRDSGCHVL